MRSRATDLGALGELNAMRSTLVQRAATRALCGLDAQAQALLLNRSAHEEVRRLEQASTSADRRARARWQKIMRQLGRMTPEARRQELEIQSALFAEDIAGRFNARVYWFAKHMVPVVISSVVSPSATARELAGKGRFLRNIVTVQGNLHQLASLQRRGTLIYVPTHSSNLDSLAVGDAIAQAALPPVVYGAGKNLLSNPMTSFFMQNLGAYRIDRRIRAPLYLRVLKAYATELTDRGVHALFFPGGTRSRSGAVETHLKLGLLGAAMQARYEWAARGDTREIFIVPVTINYELVLEAESLAREHLLRLGGERYWMDEPDESARLDRWVRFFGQLDQRAESCVLHFGRPLNLLGQMVDESGRSLGPVGQTIEVDDYFRREGRVVADEERDRAYVEELGRCLVEAFHRDTVVMAGQLVGFVLYAALVKATPHASLFVRMRREAQVRCSLEAIFAAIGRVRDALVRLEQRSELRLLAQLRSAPPPDILHRALSGFGAYHSPAPMRRDGDCLVFENPPLIYFYSRRIAPWAESLDPFGDESLCTQLVSEAEVLPWRR